MRVREKTLKVNHTKNDLTKKTRERTSKAIALKEKKPSNCLFRWVFFSHNASEK